MDVAPEVRVQSVAGVGTFFDRLEKLLALFREVLPGPGDAAVHGAALRIFCLGGHIPALSRLPVVLHDPFFHGTVHDESQRQNLCRKLTLV